MGRARSAVAARLLLGLALATGGTAASRGALAADPLVVACSAAPASVALGGTVAMRAWAADPAGAPLRYAWEAPVGRLAGQGREVSWDLTGLRPGMYAAVARVGAGGREAECVVRVLVRQDTGSRGPGQVPQNPGRETGAALLAPAMREADGYGLYSYLLLGAPPDAAARDRYTEAIAAFWSVVPEIAALEQYVPRAELNVAYVPVKAIPPGPVAASSILAGYDYARARSLLRYLPGANRDGPYLVSALKPLSGDAGKRYLIQDLSGVPPRLTASWVKEFLNQAAQERFWDERAGARLALKLRVTIGILGDGLPEVKKALDGWISWAQ